MHVADERIGTEWNGWCGCASGITRQQVTPWKRRIIPHGAGNVNSIPRSQVGCGHWIV